MRFWLKPSSPLPANEDARQRAVRDLGDWAEASGELDEIAAAAAAMLGTPAALVTVIDNDTMWVAGSFNSRVRSLERGECVCTHGLMTPADVLCGPDLQADARFAGLPIARGEDAIRFYIGSSMVTANGHAVGMLCGFDQVPREMPSVEQARALQRLAKVASARLQGAS